MTSTRERILATSLDLFNSLGERNVTTNHIAEALGISPGNLYYHFRNKMEIVFELFARYRDTVQAFLRVPEDRPLTWQDKMGYLESILHGIWSARFLHRDLAHLLNQDPRLRDEYKRFVRTTLDQGLAVYEGLREAGLIAASDEDMRGLLVNTWVLAASWAGFVHSLVPGPERDEHTDRMLLRQGIYQIVLLEAPYLRGEALTHLEEAKARYRSPRGTTLELLLTNALGSDA